MAKTGQIPREADREPRAQYAALPWRPDAKGEIEVLLITSRETRRWVIPKGWPMKRLKSPACAAREAYEEAGVKGLVSSKKLGVFHYDKRLASGRLQHVRVTVYPLLVQEETQTWPEKGQRELRWMPLAEAWPMVDEPELQALIAKFAPAV